MPLSMQHSFAENDIVVQDAGSTAIRPGTGDWEAAARAAKELRETGYDFDAWREQREFDTKQADHFP